MRSEMNRDLLVRLHQSRFIRMPFRFRRESGVVAVDAKRDGIHDKKGVLEMNGAIYFAHGLILGGMLVGFAWLVLRK